MVANRAARSGDFTSSVATARAATRSSIASHVARGLYHFRGRWAHPNSSTAGIRKNAETELEQIRILEAPIRDGAIGTDVENLLIAIVEHARAKPEEFECVRYFFDACLDAEQSTRIYGLLAQFAENMPGRGSVLSNFVLRQRRAWKNAEWNAKLKASEVTP